MKKQVKLLAKNFKFENKQPEVGWKKVIKEAAATVLNNREEERTLPDLKKLSPNSFSTPGKPYRGSSKNSKNS